MTDDEIYTIFKEQLNCPLDQATKRLKIMGNVLIFGLASFMACKVLSEDEAEKMIDGFADSFANDIKNQYKMLIGIAKEFKSNSQFLDNYKT